MAKQLDFVKMIVTGDANGANKAKFVYRVCDDIDSQLSKTAHLNVNGPTFTDTVDEFFDGYVDEIKEIEGIS